MYIVFVSGRVVSISPDEAGTFTEPVPGWFPSQWQRRRPKGNPRGDLGGLSWSWREEWRCTWKSIQLYTLNYRCRYCIGILMTYWNPTFCYFRSGLLSLPDYFHSTATVFFRTRRARRTTEEDDLKELWGGLDCTSMLFPLSMNQLQFSRIEDVSSFTQLLDIPDIVLITTISG